MKLPPHLFSGKKSGIRLRDLKTGLAFTLFGSVLGTLLLQITNIEILKKTSSVLFVGRVPDEFNY